MNRRNFVLNSLSATAAMSLGASVARAETTTPAVNKRYQFCAFTKYIQPLSYEELSLAMVDAGFDGLEATIRKGGYIEPKRAKDELPKLMEVLNEHGLSIPIMASNINRADQPGAEELLRTAASLGVKQYRMNYFRYNNKQPVLEQLNEIRAKMIDLAAMNREIGITATYQNHSGAKMVSAPLWDLQRLLEGISPSEIGCGFDIRHATVEGGFSWSRNFHLMQPHLSAIYVKDFVWKSRGKGKPPAMTSVPLGEGFVDPKFFKLVNKSKFSGPVSVHVEYLGKAGVEKNRLALKQDLKTLKAFLDV